MEDLVGPYTGEYGDFAPIVPWMGMFWSDNDLARNTGPATYNNAVRWSACIRDKKLVQHLYIHHAVYAPSSAVSTTADAHDRTRHTALLIEQLTSSIPGEGGRSIDYCCPMPGATDVAINKTEVYLKTD